MQCLSNVQMLYCKLKPLNLKALSIRMQWWKAHFPPFPISFQCFFFCVTAFLLYSQLISSHAMLIWSNSEGLLSVCYLHTSSDRTAFSSLPLFLFI